MVAVPNPFRAQPSTTPDRRRSSSSSGRRGQPKTEWRDLVEHYRDRSNPGTIPFLRRDQLPAKALKIGSAPSSLNKVETHRRGRSGRDHGRVKIRLARLKAELRRAGAALQLRLQQEGLGPKKEESSHSCSPGPACPPGPPFTLGVETTSEVKPPRKNGGSNEVARKKHGSGARTYARRMRRAARLEMEEVAINGPSPRDVGILDVAPAP